MFDLSDGVTQASEHIMFSSSFERFNVADAVEYMINVFIQFGYPLSLRKQLIFASAIHTVPLRGYLILSILAYTALHFATAV